MSWIPPEPAISDELLAEERAIKQQRVQTLLLDHKLDAVLLRRNENVAWITAGAVDRRVLLPAETGIATLLLRRDGQSFALVPNNEAARLSEEDLPLSGFESIITPWHDPLSLRNIVELAGGQRVGADVLTPGAKLLDLASVRAPLTWSEIARYRWLGARSAEAVTTVVQDLAPGVSEREMNARVSYELWRRGIEPSVLLMAVDDRIRKYKHAVAHTASLERFGMINLCARRWGLAVSLTRFVHFGAMPPELARAFSAAAFVNARLLDATRAGVTSAHLFAVAAEAYRDAGFPGEEAQHHQGGATGYLEREWVATPYGTEMVTEPQAFAWNPSVRGGKVEDTVLLHGTEIEVLTPTPQLPAVQTEAGGDHYLSAGVLIRD